MISQVITPQKETFDLTVSLPKNYLGKQVHCLFYTEEEAKNIKITPNSTNNPSDYFGILNDKEADKFEKHIRKIRKEWDRDF